MVVKQMVQRWTNYNFPGTQQIKSIRQADHTTFFVEDSLSQYY